MARRHPSVLWQFVRQVVKCKCVTTRNSKHCRFVSGGSKTLPIYVNKAISNEDGKAAAVETVAFCISESAILDIALIQARLKGFCERFPNGVNGR